MNGSPTTVSVDFLASHHCHQCWMTPLVDKQPVQDVKYVADSVTGQLLTCHYYSFLECHFVRVLIR